MSEAMSVLQQRLGLALDPFAPRALPDFFFIGGQRRFLAQRVVHALFFGGGVVLLSGLRGAGKSRMLKEILADLRDAADSCLIDATVMMDGGEIRRAVASTLGLPAVSTLDNTSLVAALVHWQPVGREPQPVALVIDDAQLLAVSALAECVSLVRGSGGRLRLLLAGEPDLVAAAEQAGAGAVERIDLPPLDAQETADYVATRLQAAGYRAEIPLSAVQSRELYQRSAGNFGAIHDTLPGLFVEPAAATGGLLARLPGRRWLQMVKELPRQHLAIAAGLLVVVVLMVLNRGGATEDGAKPVETSSDSGQRHSVALKLPTQPVEPTGQATAQAKTPPIEPLPPVEAQAPAPMPKPAPAPAPASKPEPVPTVISGQKIALPPPPPPQSPRTPPTPTQPVLPVATPPAQVAAASSSPSPAPAPATAPATKPAPASPAPAASANGGDTTADERELLSWSNKQFALQLLGAGSNTTVTKFMQQAGGVKLYAYRTELNGRPWFIVVTGPYPSRNAATAAADTLPAALRNQKPWPRAVKNIHADIRQRK